MEREGRSSTFMNSSFATNGNSTKTPAITSDSKHFTSLQIFTTELRLLPHACKVGPHPNSP